MALVTTTNLDYLATPVRLHVGDLTETTFSDSIIYTALVSAVKFLQNKWSSRYFIYASGMLVGGTTINTPDGQATLTSLPQENDVFRNPFVAFDSLQPPIIDQNDEYAVIVAASLLLRRSVISSSTAVFSNWSTPDLSYSNVQSSKALQEAIAEDTKLLDEFFKRRLGTPVKSRFPLAANLEFVRYAEVTDIIPQTVVVDP